MIKIKTFTKILAEVLWLSASDDGGLGLINEAALIGFTGLGSKDMKPDLGGHFHFLVKDSLSRGDSKCNTMQILFNTASDGLFRK